MTSEAVTVTIKEDSSTGGGGTTGGGSSSGGSGTTGGGSSSGGGGTPEAVHLPEEVLVVEILRVVTQPEGEHRPTETKPM